jgi:Ca2+/Na+ antiporter
MKTHPMLKLASALYLICGAVSAFCIAYFTVFNVLLAEEEDPSINIMLLACFMTVAMVAALLQMVAGRNALNKASLSACRSLSFSASLFCALAWVTAFLTGQVWVPYTCGVAIGLLYQYGIQKTIDA